MLNNEGSSTGPCGVSLIMSHQYEDCPLTTTFYLLPTKKLLSQPDGKKGNWSESLGKIEIYDIHYMVLLKRFCPGVNCRG